MLLGIGLILYGPAFSGWFDGAAAIIVCGVIILVAGYFLPGGDS